MKANKKGFTLIELIASIAIFSLVLTAVYTVLDSGNAMYLSGMKKEDVQSSARLAMDTISQSIRNSRVCILAYYGSYNNPNFNTINVGTGGKRLLYIEGNDNTRYMYAIEQVNGKSELHKLKFQPEGLQKYQLSNPLYEQVMDDTDKKIYNNALNSQNKLALSNISDRIALNPSDNFASIYAPVDTSSGQSNYYLLYENYGDNCYLWAKKIADGLDYKIKLDPVINTDYTVVEDDKIADYISVIDVTPDVQPDITVPLTSQNIYKLNIFVETVDADKKKDLHSSSYILNYRGGI